MVSPQGRREQVQLACQRGLSQRRACGLLGVARSTLNYELRLPAKDAVKRNLDLTQLSNAYAVKN
jgi:putative transposase